MKWMSSILVVTCVACGPTSTPCEKDSSDAGTTTPLATGMAALEFLLGEWEGEGQIRTGPGEPHRFHQKETVKPAFDGRIVVVEGRGQDPERVVHEAFAVLSATAESGTFRFSTYRGDGKTLDVSARVAGRRLEWGYSATGVGTVRYVIELDAEGRWVERGERSADGQAPWQSFLEMTLTRTGT